MCRVKKPWFCVEKDGYPFMPVDLILAVSQGVEAPLEGEKTLFGLDRPLVLMVKPGLAQPPPGIGDGLRERDIPAVLGVPAAFKEHEMSVSGPCRFWGVQFVSASVACRDGGARRVRRQRESKAERHGGVPQAETRSEGYEDGIRSTVRELTETCTWVAYVRTYLESEREQAAGRGRGPPGIGKSRHGRWGRRLSQQGH